MNRGMWGQTVDGAMIRPFNALCIHHKIIEGFLPLVSAESIRTRLDSRVALRSSFSPWVRNGAVHMMCMRTPRLAVRLAFTRIPLRASSPIANDLSVAELMAYRFARQLRATHRIESRLYDET